MANEENVAARAWRESMARAIGPSDNSAAMVFSNGMADNLGENFATRAWRESMDSAIGLGDNAAARAWYETFSNPLKNSSENIAAIGWREMIGQKIKSGKTKINDRNVYYVEVPVLKSLSTRMGVGPSGNVIKRIKKPYIDKKSDMIHLGINYRF